MEVQEDIVKYLEEIMDKIIMQVNLIHKLTLLIQGNMTQLVMRAVKKSTMLL